MNEQIDDRDGKMYERERMETRLMDWPVDGYIDG